MTCRNCDGPLVRFAVPATIRAHAPDEASHAAICATCLDVTGLEDATTTEPAFDRIDDSFPTGEGGAAFALLVGTLPSVTLEKQSALALRSFAERQGVDVHLTFDRLIAASDRGGLDPAFDFARRVRQFESLADAEES